MFNNSINGFGKIISNFLFIPLINVRDFFFIILAKHIKFRKDVAEFLISEIEINKRDDVMISSRNYQNYNPGDEATPKR